MEKVVWDGTVLTAPVPPVLVTCGDGVCDNVLTVAWTGTVNTRPPMTYISLRPSRFSYGIIKETEEFAVNLVPAALIREADFCGTYTGAKVDKFARCHLTKMPAEKIGAPLIAECPVNLECRVTRILPLGSHDLFLAEIVAVHVDGSLIDRSGRLRLERANLAAFAHGDYYALGKKIAPIGVSVGNRSSGPPNGRKPGAPHNRKKPGGPPGK